MKTKYFNDYEKAKAYAQKHNLKQCEYGDTGYMQGNEPLSYCAWNKSGDRFDDWEIECYYGWARNCDSDYRLRPAKGDKRLIEAIYGINI